MPNRKVLLVNTNTMKPPVAPIAIDYLADALKMAGFEPDLLDLCLAGDWKQSIAEHFSDRGEPALIGLSLRNTDDCYFLSQDFMIPRAKAIADEVRSKSDAPIVTGGVGFSLMPEKILDYCGLDLGIWGDGERAIVDLMASLTSGASLDEQKGLVHRKDGRFCRNGPDFFDLRELGASARSFVANERYFVEGAMGNIETKRGCNQGCIYCADPLAKGRRLRLRGPISVVNEIESLLTQGINCLHICDSEFNIPRRHAISICREIINKGLGGKIGWYAYLSPIPFDDELARLMVEAGCRGVDFGVDSGCDRMLRNLGRAHRKEDMRRTAESCHRHGITFMFDLLLGGPGETFESIEETISFIKALDPHCAGISAGVRVYAGTPLSSLIKLEGEMSDNKNLRGCTDGNDDFFKPVFYLSEALRGDIMDELKRMVGSDTRFFLGSKEEVGENYNYNENTFLARAIEEGERGAFWDILRRSRLKGE